MLYDWIKNMNFAYPENFMLLGLIPFLIWWYIKKYNRKQATIRVSAVKAFNVSTAKNFFRHVPFILRVLAISALIVALARPQKRNDQQQTQGEGIDIVLCMDISGSMAERDILPSRIEAAKEVAVNFVLDRPVDRIGIVVFSGESFSLCPLTTDKRTLVTQIQNLTIRMVHGVEDESGLTRGTVIGEGLATAVDRLSKSTAKSKVIILLTDGRENSPMTRLIDPLTALDIAKSEGVKVYSVGIGASPSAIVERMEETATAGRNPNRDFIDETLLQRIANETGGRYFRAKDKEGLQNIYNQIDQLEKSKVEVTSYKRHEELFLPLALAALAFLFLEILLRYTLLKRFP